jgi:hypothetical protein
MGKILEIERNGDNGTITVQLASGHKERWEYQRVETSTGISYIMVDREDLN